MSVSTASSVPAPARLTPTIAACLAATWLIWGSTYLAIRVALGGFPPFLQMGTRFLVAGAVLAAWVRWKRRAPWPGPRQWMNAFLVGSLMLAGGMGGTAVAEQTVGSGIIVAFVAVVPVFMTIGALFMGIRPSRLEVSGMAVGIVGVLLLTQGASFRTSTSGLAAITAAAVCWSAGSLLSQRGCRLAPGAMGFASEMLCGGLVLMLLATLRGETGTFVSSAPPSAAALAAWGYLVVFGSLIAFNAYMVLLDNASPALASSYAFVNPIVGMALGVALGGETISRFEFAAALVVLMGVVIVVRGRPSS